ncbi:MAG: VUT family protein [Methanosphaera sp.]|uniref:VUT family protein n=1 Tax=Methanosphaera sp. TaxID=2666342 RepID=UPI0025F2CE4B|nr:VUT family protein [Methanosphaera sp.]MDD6535063.1 VUT family protein [Methanosphaera sp.]MDY3955495.1 VUT family protein [Methanosphaera sp.]
MNLNITKSEKRIILSTIFCIAFMTANLITEKLIEIKALGLIFPAGVLIYPLVFVITSVITEVYGKDIAHRTLIIGIIANLFFIVMTTIILYLPSPSYYTVI